MGMLDEEKGPVAPPERPFIPRLGEWHGGGTAAPWMEDVALTETESSDAEPSDVTQSSAEQLEPTVYTD